MTSYNGMNDYDQKNAEQVRESTDPIPAEDVNMKNDGGAWQGQVVDPVVGTQTQEMPQTERMDPQHTQEMPQNEMMDPQHTQQMPQTEMMNTPQTTGQKGMMSWLGTQDIADLKARWNDIQIKFVDEPRASVEQADALVVEALEKIERSFKDRQTGMNEKWLNQSNISTEDLRTSLKSYRSFLNQLLGL